MARNTAAGAPVSISGKKANAQTPLSTAPIMKGSRRPHMSEIQPLKINIGIISALAPTTAPSISSFDRPSVPVP